MRKIIFLIICIFQGAFSITNAQQNIVITKPQLEFKDNNIIVEYNILNSQDSEAFRVWLDVVDSEGRTIESKAVSGDVGDRVAGGKDKKIYWNLTADNIYINAELNVKVNAKIVVEKSGPELTGSASGAEAVNPYVGIKRSGLVIQSLVFPGWGLSRINKGPHWLKGIAAYSCLTGAIVFNAKAVDNYNNYLGTSDIDEGNKLFTLSNKQDKISEGLVIAAVSVWLTDFIWTVAGSGKVKTNMAENGVSVESYYDPVSNVPLLAFKYSF
jgi:hypothetical protein